MGVATAANKTICGGTMFPMRFVSYDPEKDHWITHDAYGQWNTVAGTDESFFVGGYGGGFLLEWLPSKKWTPTKKNDPDSNPRFLHQAKPVINRPHDLLVYPDGRHVILAGTPGYGLTGGGLMIWDRKEQSALILKDTDMLPWHSTTSLAPLPGGKLLGGTTISAGTGGERKAKEAALYIFDMKSKKIEWHEPVIKGTNRYTDMSMGPGGLVYGFADRQKFFVFDPNRRIIIHQENTSSTHGPTVWSQGPRIFVKSPDDRTFILFKKGIAEVNPKTHQIKMLTESPVPISSGGAWLDNRIYFIQGSHLYSWQVSS
jgi:hypothetical protein